MRTAAVIPVYNEERTIAEVVARTRKFVDRVIVVDDGSKDRTRQEAERGGAEVLSFPQNRGKAAALKAGFQRCNGSDVVVMLDGDLQHLPEEIPLLLRGVRDGHDLVLGSRYYCQFRNMPAKSRFSNRVASWVISFLGGIRVTDPQSGFRAVRTERLAELDLEAERYAIEHIMILEARRKGMKIGEVPISCVYGIEVSSVKPFRDTIRVMYHVLRFVLQDLLPRPKALSRGA
jgi:glycosyltransferase involved in cell wall biosynthesis